MAKRETVLVPAEDWQKRLAALERMNAADRRQFESQRRLELSIEDLRDEIVGIVLSGHGTDDECFQACYEAGGPHPSTLRHWRDKTILSPRANTMRKAAIACGYDMRWVRV